ncbi:hypothetical protein O7626_04705 [Micromonospora sp. WMMD1102]|uniref:hypothetical protein n=1 Tax=Micromonospora sp. WMMD1102 TaxID=3016105 RepID=UPI0024153BA5|nr:hypothetical protein [Micromonospora sp. WMMD1102]MDG4785239.1 hypothetical protein [Micromonospora sp. WMMD1102]
MPTTTVVRRRQRSRPERSGRWEVDTAMEFRSLPVSGPPGSSGTRTPRRGCGDEPALVEPPPHEPLAVITVGPSAEDRRAVLAGLLGPAAPPLRVPPGSFLVVDHAPTPGGAAYVPGLRSPREYRPEPVGAGPALARPPRRVELTVPDPLLRHFTLVDAPDTGTLGVAGGRVVRDAVRRGGALLYVLPADQPVAATELDLLAEVAEETAVFLVGTPGTAHPRSAGPDPAARTRSTDGPAPPSDAEGVERPSDAEPPSDAEDAEPSPAEHGPESWLEARRATLVAAVPALAGVDWIDLDPAAADTAYLRRALIDWASAEGLRRASLTSPVPPGATRAVPVAPAARTSDWAERLDRRSRELAHRLRQDIALEIAAIHLRCVREVVGDAGVPGLPGLLDREVEALSLEVVASCDAGVDKLLAESLARVFGEVPDEGVRLRAAAAVGWGLAADRGARDFDRVLLIRETGEVETVYGLGAVAMLAGYPGGTGGAILPPLGVGLSGGCYQYWRRPFRADPIRARSWLRQALRGTELELCRQVSRRFEAIAGSLAGVLAEAVRHGRLLA